MEKNKKKENKVEKVSEQTILSFEKETNVKATTILVQATGTKELYTKFQDKCVDYEWKMDIVLIKLIEAWVNEKRNVEEEI
ncbi:hypothetical protein [Clostridium lacusfryxellense]|uniref:hypothetical protein n=1 Tax=Clostridium lacusfryxellense TaxID=205328 RepID=UPI001C0CD19F|nr:hypothetical protein [Clostridium lacusfryxellense]MBU3110295.1 hypothetical protein [Clostridium lacusfryxellense]